MPVGAAGALISARKPNIFNVKTLRDRLSAGRALTFD
jgi:hypothetical protein